MKRERLPAFIVSACLALVLTTLLFSGACSEPESPTATQEPQVTTTTQETQEPSETATPSPEVTTSPCEEFINTFEKEGVSITSATLIAATSSVPEHCEVRGIIVPNTRFAVELPTDCNGRFYMVGNGVFAGNIEYAAMQAGLSMGYATASTDTGHDSTLDPLGPLGATFAYNNPEAEIDYCFRAVHQTAVTAKEIIEAYYGNQPSYSYFVGCSTGGRQGLMEAQRYPQDFDGIVVGAPVLDFTGTMIWGIWNALALSDNGSIPIDKLKILADAIYEKCDGEDGLVDGLINNPLDCTFDPATDLPPDSFTPA